MTRNFCWLAAIVAFFSALVGTVANAQPPRLAGSDLDFAASGFVLPAGVSNFPVSTIQQAGLVTPGGPQISQPPYPQAVTPVGFFAPDAGASSASSCGCDAGTCDGVSCGGGSCSSGSCGTGGPLGLFHGAKSCGSGSCGNCGGPGGLVGRIRDGRGGRIAGVPCPFCGGSRCGVCEGLRPEAITRALSTLLPYQEAGLCSQRWYDLSVEAVFLGHTLAGTDGPATSLGVAGPTVLSFDDARAGDDLEAGVRASAAFILGVGGNIEATFLGGFDWEETASVTNADPVLFSFISEFGLQPPFAIPAGFDDIDRSISQSIVSDSDYNSGEINYRRRTVGPYCRFQGSWLVGLRYLRFDNGLLYSALGENDNAVNANLPRFFSSDTEIENEFFGGQVGFDLWYNAMPGVSIGVGAKGAWGQNDIRTRTVVQSNSIASLATPGALVIEDVDRDTTLLADVEVKLAYRVNHSWTFRSAYYMTAFQDLGQATIDGQEVLGIFDSGTEPVADAGRTLRSLVLQGFSFGAEYSW